MPVKATITDLQKHRVYRGTLRTGVRQGENVELSLDDKPGYMMSITRVRGWLTAIDDDGLFYLFDVHGKRFKVRISPMVIDSKP